MINNKKTTKTGISTGLFVQVICDNGVYIYINRQVSDKTKYVISTDQIKSFDSYLKSDPNLCECVKSVVDSDMRGEKFDKTNFQKAISIIEKLDPSLAPKQIGYKRPMHPAYFPLMAYRFHCYARKIERNTTPKACSTPIPVTNTIPQNTIVSVQSPSYITKVAMSYPDNIRKQLDLIAKKMYEDDLVRSWRTFAPMTVYKDFDGTGFTAGYKYAMLYALMNGDMKTFNECMKAKEREYNFSRLSQEMKEYVYSAVLDNINRNKSQLITAAENTYSESKGYHQSVMDNASDAYEKYVNLKPWEKGVVSTSGC